MSIEEWPPWLSFWIPGILAKVSTSSTQGGNWKRIMLILKLWDPRALRWKSLVKVHPEIWVWVNLPPDYGQKSVTDTNADKVDYQMPGLHQPGSPEPSPQRAVNLWKILLFHRSGERWGEEEIWLLQMNRQTDYCPSLVFNLQKTLEFIGHLPFWFHKFHIQQGGRLDILNTFFFLIFLIYF